MTSRGCFVYITLPQQTNPVVAGRLEISSRQNIETARFVYGRSYLARANAVEIDPVDLNVLDSQTYTQSGIGPLFSSIRDASPDSWGRRVIERALGGTLHEIDYLLNSPDDRAGALSFGHGSVPPGPMRQFNRTIQLPQLLETSDALLAGDKPADADVGKQVQQLQQLGSAMGGARPKAVIEDDEGLWLAKFPRQDDQFDQPRVELAMLSLAEVAGLRVARSRIETVSGRSVLFVKRFDRERAPEGYYRHRMISGLTLLQAPDSAMDRDRWSYLLLADQLRRFDGDETVSREELFNRMVFNALIANSDDHPRNHAMIADEKGWRLSPAYDLTPTPQISPFDRSLAMAIGDNGRAATAANLLSRTEVFGLSRDKATDLIRRMRELIRREWYGVCRSAGVSDGDCDFISSAFNQEGFDPDGILNRQGENQPEIGMEFG